LGQARLTCKTPPPCNKTSLLKILAELYPSELTAKVPDELVVKVMAFPLDMKTLAPVLANSFE
jgi:hypothetical protein